MCAMCMCLCMCVVKSKNNRITSTFFGKQLCIKLMSFTTKKKLIESMVSLSETFYVVVVVFFALFSSFAGVLKFHQQNGCTTSASTKFKVDALFKKAICMSESRIKTQITNSGAVKMAMWEKTYMKLIRCHAQKEIDCFRFSSFYLMHMKK